MSSYWMHNDPIIFPEPDVFDPMRWIDAEPEQLKVIRAYSVPFAKGSRNCVGQKYSFILFQSSQVFHIITSAADLDAVWCTCSFFTQLPDYSDPVLRDIKYMTRKSKI